MSDKPEVWQRGPLPDIHPVLQPIAHALLQAREEIPIYMKGYPQVLLWSHLAGLASPGFHLQHLSGVLDRTFTYARGESLTPAQFEQLHEEGNDSEGGYTIEELLDRFSSQVDKAILQLKNTDPATFGDYRAIGRAGLPSTVIGLMVHAAEHTMRHVGQLLVTTGVLKGGHNLGY